MTATPPPGQPATTDGLPIVWRLVADFANDVGDETRDRLVTLFADAVLDVDPAAEVYAGRPSLRPATDPCRPAPPGQPRATDPGPAAPTYALVADGGQCGCCAGTGEHPCGHECDSCDGAGRDPDSPVCTLPHGADCRCPDPGPAAPTTYQLPAEPPPEVTELWDKDGDRWERSDGEDGRDSGWVPDTGDGVWDWPEVVVEYGPLSTVPPAGTETGS